jgi:hypothetical protein
MSATLTSLESRDTKYWHQLLNNLIEAWCVLKIIVC